MPKNINRVELQGHLGRDPDLRYTASGSAVCNFSIATTDRRKDKTTGEWGDGDTHWHNISVWGSAAERCAEMLRKGDCARLEGKITYSKKDDKIYTNIVAFEVTKIEKEERQQAPADDDQIPF
jgi:single-strand DNA-binding protein